MEAFNEMTEGLSQFLTDINWKFTFGLILVSRVFIKDNMVEVFRNKKFKDTMKQVPKGWRVFIIGLIYGAIWLSLGSSWEKQEVVSIVNSIIFTMVFHELLLKKLLDRLEGTVTKLTKK